MKYATSVLGVDVDEMGGSMSVAFEGFMPSLAAFLVSADCVYAFLRDNSMINTDTHTTVGFQALLDICLFVNNGCTLIKRITLSILSLSLLSLSLSPVIGRIALYR